MATGKKRMNLKALTKKLLRDKEKEDDEKEL